MKIEKIIELKEEKEINIKEVTLLSRYEFNKCKDNISLVNEWWWLRSPGSYQYFAASIDGCSLENEYVNIDDGCVRPALKILNQKSTNLKSNDKFYLAGYRWTMISEDIALCNECVGKSAFRFEDEAEDANVWEVSDAKKWLDNWAKKNGLVKEKQFKQQEIIRCENCRFRGVKYESGNLSCKKLPLGYSHEPDWFCADGKPKDS